MAWGQEQARDLHTAKSHDDNHMHMYDVIDAPSTCTGLLVLIEVADLYYRHCGLPSSY